jgi:DNA-binding transcriptional MerR regulator/F0F1-type ATP synthase membrane subunit c/vacuolar-type H+-ATPase subunit K
MLATITSIPGRLRRAVSGHALAAGISIALAAGVAGLGAGFALATSSPAATESPTAAIVSGASTSGGTSHPIIRGLVGLTARETGQSLSQIRTLLRQNQTLDQIAGAQAGAVVQAADAAVTTRVSAAVAHGKLSSQQAATLTTRADDRISQVMSAPGRGLLRALQGGATPSSSPSPSPAATPTPSTTG